MRQTEIFELALCSRELHNMRATLYLPNQPPQPVTVEGLILPNIASGFPYVPKQVAVLLGCAPNMVDVLASGPGYAAYSIFDSEEECNPGAMAAVEVVAGVTFDPDSEDELLRGPVLVAHM
jgi:hypothetical protein